MLVISRKNGQEIQIGENVRIKVLEIRGNRIRLGIEAPLEVEVRRQELPQGAEHSSGIPDLLELELAGNPESGRFTFEI